MQRLHRVEKRRWLYWMTNNPPLFFLSVYLFVVILGTFALALPWSSRSLHHPGWINTFFISTSAVCVTGLSPVVSVVQWSFLGQFIMLLLIQFGGLGIMTAVAAVGMLRGRTFGLQDRRLMMEQSGVRSLQGIVRLMRFILGITFGIEALGAFLLSLSFIPTYGWGRGIWYSIFHAVSAFCNAGFDLIGAQSLKDVHAPMALLTLSGLIVIAGIGFTVLWELMHKKHRLSLHARMAISMTLILLVGGTLGFYLLERNNPATLGSYSEGWKWLHAWFQSVTTRTAGYFSISPNNLTSAGTLLTIALMFIGGSPGGTAGGIKTTTFMTLAACARSQVQGGTETEIFYRSLSNATIRRAFVIACISFAWCAGMLFLLSITDRNLSLLDLQFEIVSAFGTVGLSCGITSLLSAWGKLLIAGTMIFGKLGPMMIFYAILPHQKETLRRLAEEEILVG